MVWHRGRTRSGAPRGDADPEARASSSSSSSLRLAELLPARPDAETDSARLGDYRLVPDAPSPRGHPRDPRGRLVSPTSANAEGWRVDAPVRLRGRLARGRPDVVLELFRVESLPERPAGAPTRGSDWTRTSAGGGVGTRRRASSTSPRPPSCSVRGRRGPARAGRARRLRRRGRGRRAPGRRVRDQSAEDGETSGRRSGCGRAGREPGLGSASARLAAVAARACEGALALYVSGAALRVVNPGGTPPPRGRARGGAGRREPAARARRENPPPPPPPPPRRGRTPDGFAGRALGPVLPVPPVPPGPGGVGTSPGPPGPPDFDARAWHASTAGRRSGRWTWSRRGPPPAGARLRLPRGVALNVAAGRREDARAGNGREDAAFANARLGDAGRWFGARREELRSAGTSARRGRRGSTSRGSRRAAGPSGRGARGAATARARGRWAGAPWRVREGGTGRTSSSRA